MIHITLELSSVEYSQSNPEMANGIVRSLLVALKRFMRRRGFTLVNWTILLLCIFPFGPVSAVPYMMVMEKSISPMIKVQVSDPHGIMYREENVYPRLTSVEDLFSELTSGEIDDLLDELSSVEADNLLSGPLFALLENQQTTEHPNVSSQEEVIHQPPFDNSEYETETNMPLDSILETTHPSEPETHIEINDDVVKVVTVFDLSDFEDVEVENEHSH